MPRTNRLILNDRIVKAAKPAAGRQTADLFDALVPGLVLRVSASTRRVFYVVYRKAGATNKTWLLVKDPTLTSYEYPHVTLARARELARAVLAAVLAGRDPGADQDAATTAKETDAQRTVRALGAKFIDEYAKVNKKSWDDDAANLRTQVYPAWGDRRVSSIRRADVKDLIASIVTRGAKVRANRVLSLICTMLNFAVDREWVESNVAARIGKLREEKRRRRLSDAEVLKFWQWCQREPAADLDATDANNWRLFRALLQLRLITTARGGEILNMTWGDLDWTAGAEWWTIPVTKNGRGHRLPLTAPALAVLRALESRATDLDPESFVFQGIRGKVQRRGQLVDLPFKGFLPRDLRRTATTYLAQLGVPRFDVRRILNHADGDVTADYDEYAYGPEKRAALEKWAGKLVILTTPPSSLRLIR